MSCISAYQKVCLYIYLLFSEYFLSYLTVWWKYMSRWSFSWPLVGQRVLKKIFDHTKCRQPYIIHFYLNRQMYKAFSVGNLNNYIGNILCGNSKTRNNIRSMFKAEVRRRILMFERTLTLTITSGSTHCLNTDYNIRQYTLSKHNKN